MGKKGSKRKTRWRTLSIGAPPDEEDDEDGLRNGYMTPWKIGRSDGGPTRRRDEATGSPSQSKAMFNEDEYTKITTPRQDLLFKKGYFSKKKESWTGNANTSATSSTTESQSASHSTADGSEITEDQQLLDRDPGTGEYSAGMDSDAQLGYVNFYHPVNRYYYEYPVMLVGPAPMTAQVAPNVLAAVPCGPVPLRPIEWMNPTFVPGDPHCVMDYEENQDTKDTMMMEEQEDMTYQIDNSNGLCNESGTGSASYSGSVAGENEEPADKATEEPTKKQCWAEEQVEEQPVEKDLNDHPYYEPMLVRQPVHVSHVIPAVPQPYMYPGHYMFGPPLISMNGVTIQGGPMYRTTDVATISTAYTKRRKKKKWWRQRRVATGNTEDEEEGEYSSECDTGLPSSRLCWTACTTSTTTTTTTTTTTGNWSLNPECQEFQLQRVVESNTSLPAVPNNPTTTPTSDPNWTLNHSSTLSSDSISIENEKNDSCNGIVHNDTTDHENKRIENIQFGENIQRTTPAQTEANSLLENDESIYSEVIDKDIEADSLTNRNVDTEVAVKDYKNEIVSEIEKVPLINTKSVTYDSSNAPESRLNNVMNGETIVNGKLDRKPDSDIVNTKKSVSPCSASKDEKSRSRSHTPKSVENLSISEEQNHESLSSSKSSSSSPSKRKYCAKNTKFIREPTPGPDLDSTTETENDTKIHELSENFVKISFSNDSKSDSVSDKTTNNKIREDQDQISNNKFGLENSVCNHLSKEEEIEALNEDSGFESQTRLSDYPIMEAVTEWLRREKSPDLFITSSVSMDCEEDEDMDEEEQSKNLHGNPIPALSVNSTSDNKLTTGANYGEFAKISNVKGTEHGQQSEGNNNSCVLRKKKETKKRSEQRRRVVRHVTEGKLDHDVVSSSDSCGQQEDMTNVLRRKTKQQQDVVGDVCELTEKDSVAGMRVAQSSQMDSKRSTVRRTKRQGKSYGRDFVNNTEIKIKCIDNVDGEKERIVDDNNTVNVKTFEKGEIVVSEEGKLLTTSVYKPALRNTQEISIAMKIIDKKETSKQTTEEKVTEKNRSSSDEDEESGSVIGSLDSIEEPDVLECWEAEIIEPIITPKRLLQSEGVLCEGEAAEDETIEIEQANVEYVQKYYRLARDSVTSIEDEINSRTEPSSSSKIVPNESLQNDEFQTKDDLPGEKDVIPIEEAFEAYESCYTGNTSFLTLDPKILKSRTLYGQEGESPIPCRAVCCLIQ